MGQVKCSRTAEIGLDVQGAAVPQLDRKFSQARLDQVSVGPCFGPGREAREPVPDPSSSGPRIIHRISRLLADAVPGAPGRRSSHTLPPIW